MWMGPRGFSIRIAFGLRCSLRGKKTNDTPFMACTYSSRIFTRNSGTEDQLIEHYDVLRRLHLGAQWLRTTHSQEYSER